MLKKSQSAVELIVILSISLILLTAVISIFLKTETSFSNNLETKKARAMIDSLADAAERVYQQGAGSRTRVYVAMPNNVNYINLTNRLLQINFGNNANVYRTLDFNISGSLPINAGSMLTYVTAKEGYVLISQNLTN